MSRNMYKVVSNANKTKSSIKGNRGSYTYWKYLKDYEISINIIGPLSRSNGIDAIVVIVDQFTKIIQLKAMTTNISSEGIAKIYRDNIWKLHRVPRKILSDWGPQFTSKFIGELTKALETTRQLLTAYHPQKDGQTERINQEIGTFLRHYINYQQDN